jgi:hypothetical protein
VAHEISVKGRMRQVPAWRVDDVVVIAHSGMLEIFDAYWVEADRLPDLPSFIDRLKAIPAGDVFTFTERVPQTTPRYDFHCEWDNVAVVPVSTHEHWLQKQVSAATRRNVRTAEKKGVVVRSCAFDEAYVRGIMAISDESPIRAGRKYWHYGKDFAAVEAEQGTYRERSSFLAAYVGAEMVGYLKLVWDRETAAIMQIVSKMAARDHRPNNALLSEAVRLCAERGVQHLLYERFVYGKKEDSSLTRFKRENGFVRVDVPCYYVPLTAKGRVVLSLGLHRPLKDRLPNSITSRLIRLRDFWLAHRAART